MRRMDEDKAVSPVSHPKLTLLGTEYTIKYRAGDVRRLAEAGVDILGDKRTLTGTAAVNAILLQFKHGVAHQVDVDIEKLEDQLELTDLQTIQMACQEAQLKAAAQASENNGPALKRLKVYSDQIMKSIPQEMIDAANKARELSDQKPN